MPIQILSDNMELTSSMKVLAEQKLEPLLAHIKQRSVAEASIRVVMNKAQEPGKFLAKIETIVDGKTYFGDEEDFALETALIRTVDEVDKQYLKDKEKAEDRDREVARDLKRFDTDGADSELNADDVSGEDGDTGVGADNKE